MENDMIWLKIGLALLGIGNVVLYLKVLSLENFVYDRDTSEQGKEGNDEPPDTGPYLQ